MIAVPTQLFSKASGRGLTCIVSDKGNHCIRPNTEQPDWQLTYQKGFWILMVNETPQMRLGYDEAMKCLDRFG